MNNMNNKICVHQYLTKISTSLVIPGIADFLRGSKTLYLLCKKYNYNLLIDYNIHPIFKYFKYNSEFYIKNSKNNNTIELIYPLEWKIIYEELEKLFSNNDNIFVFTNSFFNIRGATGIYNNENNIESNNFIKNILIPDTFLENLYNNKIKEFNMKIDEKYIIIHIRIVDKCFTDTNFSLSDIENNNIINKIKEIINNNINNKIIVISNFNNLIKNLKNIFNEIYFTNSLSIHLGYLSNIEDETSIQETLLDLLFLKNASIIYGISQYGGSGFSETIAEIYNIVHINCSSSIFTTFQ